MGHANGTVAYNVNSQQVVPHSREAELSVIGSLLIDPDALLEVIGWLLPEHFYMHDCRTVYQAILDLHSQNRPYDLVILSSYFEKLGAELQSQMTVFLMGALNEVPTSINVKHYAEIVKERATRRAILATCAKGTTSAYNTELPIDEVVSGFQSDVFQATSDTSGGKLAHIRTAAAVYLEKLERARLNPQALSGLSTGLRSVDAIIGGLRKQDLLILAGDTSMGKTAGALTIVNHLIKDNKRGAFFSLEMSTEQLINRLVSMRISVSWKALQTGNISQEQMGRAYTEIARITDAPLYIDDTPAQTPEQLLSKARKLTMTHGLDYIIVDYLGLIHVPEAKGNQYTEVSIASKRLKGIAKEIDVPLISLAQISRSNKQRGDKRPLMSDLRDSGNVEQDADVIVFLYRDEYFNENTEHKNIAEWIVRKNRTGGTLGTAETFFKSEYGLFTSLERNLVSL